MEISLSLSQGTWGWAFHSQRSHLVRYLVFFLFCDLLCAALLLGLLFLTSGVLFIRPSPFPSLVIAVQIFMSVLSVLALFLVTWVSSFALFTMRRLVSHKPALLITHQGIDFQDLPVTGNTFLSWSEIASLSILPVYAWFSKPTGYLCLDPKDHIQFLLRFHPLRRFFIRLGSLNTSTLIKMPQWFLSVPVEEVLLQIREIFREELNMYQIQVGGTPSERESR